MNPLHAPGGPHVTWTTVNVGEAAPGVPTPLSWTFVSAGFEAGLRGGFCDLGALARRDLDVAAVVDHRFVTVVFGRAALNLDLMRRMADSLPGSSGNAVELGFFGSVRPGVRSGPVWWRYPVAAAKMPAAVAVTRRRLAALRAEIEAWHRSVVPLASEADTARRLLADALSRCRAVSRPHIVASMIAQGLYEQVGALCRAAGQSGLEHRLLRDYRATNETRTVADLWAVSRGRMTLDQFVAAHGHHGPQENELSTRSWREDPAPLQALVATYQAMPDDQGPTVVERRQQADQAAAEAEFMRRLAGDRRVAGRLLLRFARAWVPYREVGRDAFVRTYDVARASTRALGRHLAGSGRLAGPDDVFYLTVPEVLSPAPPLDTPDLVEERRKLRKEYAQFEVPQLFTGVPDVEPDADRVDGDRLAGLGVAAGTVEGLARVIHDPSDSEALQPGEILVCRTTDPSWASYFLVAAGVVIDIGGPLSHGAIVARELGIPCVINTRTGTRMIRTGDRLVVDGRAGVVKRLS